MADRAERLLNTFSRRLTLNQNPEKDINILLLGETGVGKTTFINAFPNYLVYDNLDAALKGDMQVLIPSAFSISDAETHEARTVTVGTRDENELCEDNGQSQTQGCKSYVFPIGDRCIRFIDTPGVADCRGVAQDNENFAHVLAYISRYEHLNGICILFKPNDNRLGVSFRYIVKESLNHLHVNAKDNIMFVFTNGRTNFYGPGATANQLKILLGQIEASTQTKIPFNKENTFIFDNESFRYLAICKAGHHFFDQQKSFFSESWSKSVTELNRLIHRIVKCGLHAVRDFQSLNEAQQLIHKLSRPIAEVATLIQENIQLAEQHREKILANANNTNANRIPEKVAEVISLRHPRTICTSIRCSIVTEVDGAKKVDYLVQCHERCRLRGVEQEVINNPVLKRCSAMNKITGECRRCGCSWNSHMHVTYEFRKRLTSTTIYGSPSKILSRIEQRITLLKEERRIIRHICNKLRLFIQMSSLNPTNEDVIEYINHFIREEKQKLDAGDNNTEIIRGLEKLIEEYQEEFKQMKKNKEKNKDPNDIPTIDDVFACKYQLFELPVTGKYFKQQVDSLNRDQLNHISEREVYVDYPWNARSSMNMRQLEQAIQESS